MVRVADNFMLWILLMLTLPEEAFTSEKKYKISVPSVYVAFSGDLRVNYSTPSDVSLPNAFIRLFAETPTGRKEITTAGMHVGIVIIECGIIEFPGRHVLEMHMYDGGDILTQAVFIVKWPHFRLKLPETHIAQTTNVTLSLVSGATCKSRLKRYSFQIDLEYRIESPDNPGFYSEKPNIVYTYPVMDVSKYFKEFTYQCGVFDMQGSYTAVLRNSINMSLSISESNVMLVSWNTSYFGVNIFQTSIYPCNGHVPVYYSHPICTGDNDKLRMYMLKRNVTGSLAAPLQDIYVTEVPADKSRSYVAFRCSLFHPDAAGYCFVYVSVSKNGKVTEQRRFCVSAHMDSVLPIDGKWNKWTLWGDCSVTCGSGQRSRFRMCNNPSPTNGGRFCVGDPFQWKPCYTPCPDEMLLSPLHSPVIDENCPCGCSLDASNSSGEIIGTGRCNGLSTWSISAENHHIIKLKFNYFALMKNKQWVKIRNGDNPNADLLAVSDGSSMLTDVVSSSNKILIEFMSKSNSTNHRNVPYSSLSSTSSYIIPTELLHQIHVHGFIAIYSTLERKNTTAVSFAVPLESEEPNTMWKSTVTIVGISLCVVIVIVVVAFAIYHRIFHKKKYKYAMATQDDSPMHVAKSTSMNSTPSHHSNISAGIEIDYDMERPLTSQSKKKENGTSAFNSRKSSVSSNRSKSSNKIRFKTKPDVECGGSPKPSSRQYTPLSSPCVHNDVIEEITRDDKGSLFNTSPLIGKKPRSPKIHPSPRIKRTLGSKTPDAPVETKHDMLRRKRKKSESKADDTTPVNKSSDIRIVTGAAVVCTVEEKPRLLSTPDTPGTVTPTAKISPLEKLPKHLKKDRTKKEDVLNKDNLSDSSKHKPKGDILLDSLEKSDEAIRKSGSGASDESSPDKIDKGGQQTTSFIRQPTSDVKPRRPTSLHESYTKSPSMPSLGVDNSGSLDNVDKSNVPPFDRTKVLPKPDGQSPKSPRNSKSSTPKSVHSSKSRLTLSPSRSIHTPSEVASENLEMEYDDYIDYDDPLSYFEPEELEKLKWKGAEKIGKPRKGEDD